MPKRQKNRGNEKVKDDRAERQFDAGCMSRIPNVLVFAHGELTPGSLRQMQEHTMTFCAHLIEAIGYLYSYQSATLMQLKPKCSRIGICSSHQAVEAGLRTGHGGRQG